MGAANAFNITDLINLKDQLPNRPVDFAPPATVVLGVNQVAVGASCIGFACTDTFDSIRFVVPNGLEITLTEFLITSAPAPPEPFGAAFVVLADDGVTIIDPPNDPRFFPTLSILASGLIGFNSNTVGQIFQSSVVLGPGLYDVVFLNGGHGTSQALFTATPAPIPVPLLGHAAWGVLVAGLATMVLLMMRRTQSD